MREIVRLLFIERGRGSIFKPTDDDKTSLYLVQGNDAVIRTTPHDCVYFPMTDCSTRLYGFFGPF